MGHTCEKKPKNIKTLDMLMALIELEFVNATSKFGSFHNTHEGYAVLKEEVDELWDEVKANNTKGACDEAVQVGAMALRFLFDCAPKDWIEKQINDSTND